MTPGLSARRRWAIRLAQFAFVGGIFAVLWHAADGREAIRLLRGADPLWLVAAVGALTVQTVLSALRWRLTASRLGIRVDVPTAVREYYLSQILNQSLPGGMVGDAARAVRSRADAGLTRAGQAVVLERLMGQIVMFLFLAGAFLVTWAVPGGLDWPPPVAVPVGMLLAAGFATPAVVWAAEHLPGLAGRAAQRLREIVREGLTGGGTFRRQMALSLGTATCNLAAFAFCAAAIGVTLPFVTILAVVPIVLFAMLVPLSVSGWGLREGAAATLFPIAGATAAQGFAASVAFGLAFLVAVLPGAVPLLRGSGAPKNET